jgi:hypothetical protein
LPEGAIETFAGIVLSYGSDRDIGFQDLAGRNAAKLLVSGYHGNAIIYDNA